MHGKPHDPAGRPWDEGCFAYGEDVDLDWRLARLGWRCRYRPDAVATHERHVALGAAPGLVQMLNWRNRWRDKIKPVLERVRTKMSQSSV